MTEATVRAPHAARAPHPVHAGRDPRTAPSVRLGRVHGTGATRVHARPRCAPARSDDRHHLATAFAQRLVEVLTGQRPRDQLHPHTSFPVSERLGALIRQGALRPESGCRPALHRVYESEPAEGVVEVCACVRLAGGRLEMLAFRLELRCDQRGRRGWTMTALETSGTAAR